MKFTLLSALLISGIYFSSSSMTSGAYSEDDKVSGFAVMTYVSDNEQERAVRALVQSIREWAGEYRDCRILVAYTNPDEFRPTSLEVYNNVELIPLRLEQKILAYPLAVKAFAASLIEELTLATYQTLVWFDPGVLVLNTLESLDLEDKYDIAVKPVSLSNNISLAPETPPNDYWTPIYSSNGLDFNKLPILQTIVDEVYIQPYYNCEVYSVNPTLGICREWARQLSVLLNDNKYQKESCTTFTRRLFLHQAVLSGIITSRVTPDRIRTLPVTSGYPFNQHDQLNPSKQVSSLNRLSVIIFDYAWSRIPSWMNKIPVEEPLKGWLVEAYSEYLEQTP